MKKNTKIGIICAMERELSPFLPHIDGQEKIKKAMLTFYQGQIDGMDVVAVACGICKTNAAVATQILIDHFGAGIVVNSGSAGGIHPSLNLLDTAICVESAHHDVEDGILENHHPKMATPLFKADSDLIQLTKSAIKAMGREQVTHYGRMVTGEVFITEDGRQEIIDRYNPLSVDMETASIAHTAYVNNIPYITIRTITDTANDAGEDNFFKYLDQASALSKDTILALIAQMN